MTGGIVFEQVGVTFAGRTDHAARHRPRDPRGRAGAGRRGDRIGQVHPLRCFNGLVPHFTGGTLHGRVLVAGRDTRTHPPRSSPTSSAWPPVINPYFAFIFYPLCCRVEFPADIGKIQVSKKW